MKVVLLSVGKTDNINFVRVIEDYQKRVNFYVPFEVHFIADIKKKKGLSVNELKEEEGKKLLGCLQPSDHVVLLDNRGRQYDSPEFAAYLEKKMISVPKRLVFIAGGAYGFSPALYERATEKVSLSAMTFTHQMVRVIFTEQLYRAMTILNNEPYHHE